MEETNITDMEITQEEFSNVINNSDKLVVVDFFAEWCMPCLMMAPILEDLATQMNEVRFVKINTEDNEECARKHSISTKPCLVIFKEGKEVGRILGSHSAEVIERKIRVYLN